MSRCLPVHPVKWDVDGSPFCGTLSGMRKLIGVAVVAAALGLAPRADAQVALDLKLGYAIPTGDVMAFGPWRYYGPMTNLYSGAIPIGVGARWRFSPSLSVGAYFQYAPALVASRACASGFSCSGSDTRVGVEAVYAFLPASTWNPWVSLGTGWEWSTLKVSAGGQSVSQSMNGWEYFNVQAGLDWNLSRTFAVGPWLGFFGGSYSNASFTDEAGSTSSGTIDSGLRAFHGWLQFGLKGTVYL